MLWFSPFTCSASEDLPVELPSSSTDIAKSSGDGCFLTLLDWLSRVRGEQKRANKELNQSKGDNLLDPDTLNQTEFLADLLFDELYDGKNGDGNEECRGKGEMTGDGVNLASHNGGKKTYGEGQNCGDDLRLESNVHQRDGFESDISVINVDSYDISVDQTFDNEVDFILGESDKSRTPLSILKAEVLEFGNEDTNKTPPKTDSCKDQPQKTIVPETPIFDQISVDSFVTSRTPLLDGSLLTHGAEHELSRLADKDEVLRLDFSNIEDVSDAINLTGPVHSKHVDNYSLKKMSNKNKSKSDNFSISGIQDTSSIIVVEENVVNIESDNQKTPLKLLGNLPVHKTSPFIKKLATDKVTKRKSRRKRHIDSSSDYSDRSDMSDSKELCKGLSPGVQDSKTESDVEMDLLPAKNNENVPVI